MITDIRNSPLNENRDWMVVSRYKNNLKPGQVAGEIAMVTVHTGEWSKDLELDANANIGREAIAYDLRGLDKWQRKLLYQKETGLEL